MNNTWQQQSKVEAMAERCPVFRDNYRALVMHQLCPPPRKEMLVAWLMAAYWRRQQQQQQQQQPARKGMVRAGRR